MGKLLYILLFFQVPYSLNAQRRTSEQLYAIAHSILSKTSQGILGKTSQEAKAKSNIFSKDSDSNGVKLLCSYDENLQLISNVDDNQDVNTENNTPEIYIYGRENGKPGYVILSSREQTHPILAFSEDEDIDIMSIPEATKDLLKMYVSRSCNDDLSSDNLRHISLNKSSMSSSQEPLLGEIKYNQTSPYNDMCPTYNGSETYLGCGPTAMAEIMAYYKYPQCMNSSLGNISYITKTYGINASWDCGNTVFDWDNVLDTYISYAPITQVSIEENDVLSFLGFEHSDIKNKIQLNYITNISGALFAGELQLLLADMQGNFITTAGDSKKLDNFPSRNYYKKLDISITMPQSLTDGEYRIYFAAKPSGNEKWSLVRRAKSESISDRFDTSSFVDDYISVYKTGNNFSYDGQLFTCGYNEQQAEAISTLCGACAHAAHADFGTDQTPASDIKVIDALVKYMNYSNEIRCMKPEYFEPVQWHSYIQEELESMRPLFITGVSSSAGHEFIIDGYQNIDGIPYYHVNWGWNGVSNGYFLLDYMKPSEAGDGGYEYNFGEKISIFSHVQPSNDNNFANQLACTSISSDKLEYSEGEKIKINMRNLSNRTARTIENGEVLFYLVSESGVDFFLGKIMDLTTLKFCNYYKDLNKSITIPSSIPTGNYVVDLRFIDSNSSEYSHVQSPTTVQINITNNTFTSCNNINCDEQPFDVIYDLSGRRLVSSNGKKIVITKGKKILH